MQVLWQMVCCGARCGAIWTSALFGSNSAVTAATAQCEMSASCRRLVTCVVFCVAWFELAMQGYAWDQFNQPPPAPNDCHVIYEGSGSGQGKIIEIHGHATIDCD